MINNLLKEELKIHTFANKPLYCYNYPEEELKEI